MIPKHVPACCTVTPVCALLTARGSLALAGNDQVGGFVGYRALPEACLPLPDCTHSSFSFTYPKQAKLCVYMSVCVCDTRAHTQTLLFSTLGRVVERGVWGRPILGGF